MGTREPRGGFDITRGGPDDSNCMGLMRIKNSLIPDPAICPRRSVVRRSVVASVCLGLICLGIFGLLASHAPVSAQDAPVFLLKIEKIINPVKARVIARAVEKAEEAGAPLLVIEINTPGGLYDSTRDIVGTLLESRVPVAVFVSPRGAHAGSAGTYITAAAHIAAMAPGTNIGAATPVSGGGEELPETLADKVTNDAAALIRSIADERGRNADALEETVRSAASFSAAEAVEAGIIDLVADNISDLLNAVDGLTVVTAAGEQELDTAGSATERINLQWRERFVDFIANPNIAFLLLSLGGLGLVIEMITPGTIGPGVAGAICLLLAFLALGNLPFNWAGIVFIALAGVLAVLEVFISGFGALGVGAVVSLVVGGLLLFGGLGSFGGIPANFPDLSVSLWALGSVGGILALSAGYIAFEAVRSRRGHAAAGSAPTVGDSDGRSEAGHLIGQTGVVTSALEPRGIIALSDETWSAISAERIYVPVGRPVRVVGSDGLIVMVEEIGGAGAPEGQE